MCSVSERFVPRQHGLYRALTLSHAHAATRTGGNHCARLSVSATLSRAERCRCGFTLELRWQNWEGGVGRLPSHGLGRYSGDYRSNLHFVTASEFAELPADSARSFCSSSIRGLSYDDPGSFVRLSTTTARKQGSSLLVVEAEKSVLAPHARHSADVDTR